MERPTPIKDAAVHRLAKSITQLTLCQVTTSEVDDATKLLEKARQKLQGIQNIPSQRVIDLEAAIRQLRQIGCILDSCTISASYEVTQAQKAILQLHHTARGASTSSEELNAQISPRTDDEYCENSGLQPLAACARRPTLGVRAAPAMPIKLAKTRKQTKLKLSDLTSLNLTFFSQHTKRQVKCPWLCSSHCAVSLSLLFCC